MWNILFIGSVCWKFERINKNLNKQIDWIVIRKSEGKETENKESNTSNKKKCFEYWCK